MGIEVIELVMNLETEFGVPLGEPQSNDLATVGSLFDFVVARVRPSRIGARGPYSGPLWERYLDILAPTTGAERDELRPETRFLLDLGFG
jgi:hypothetical protein